MKQAKQIKILAICLVAVLTLWGVLTLWQPQSTEKEPDIQITDLKVGNVQALVMQNGSGTIGLFNLPEGIQVEGRDTQLYAQEKLKQLVYSMAHLQAQREVDTGTHALAEYGLDEPRAQVSLLLEDQTLRLLLGRENPLSGEYYLKRQDSDRVWMVDADTAGLILQSVEDMRNLSLFPTVQSSNQSLLTKVTLENKAGAFALQLLQTDTVSSFYAMVEPVVTALNWENVDSLIMNPLKELQPKQFVSDNVPLDHYGLDKPSCVLTLEYDNQIYRCGFSPRDPDSWYCANLDTTLVSLVSAEQVAFLETDFMDLIGNSIYSQSLADISSISLKWPEGRLDIAIEGYFTELTGIAENFQLDYLQLSEFYGKIDSIPAATVLTTEETMQGSPILTLSVSLRNGQENILEFYPISDRQCAVYVDGVAEFSTYTTVVLEMIAVAQDLL